jgi:hypothetical protein
VFIAASPFLYPPNSIHQVVSPSLFQSTFSLSHSIGSASSQPLPSSGNHQGKPVSTVMCESLWDIVLRASLRALSASPLASLVASTAFLIPHQGCQRKNYNLSRLSLYRRCCLNRGGMSCRKRPLWHHWWPQRRFESGAKDATEKPRDPLEEFFNRGAGGSPS